MTLPQPYNLTAMGNSSGYLELIKTVNDSLMFGWFGTLLIAAAFAIMFLSFTFVTGGNASKSFVAASFISFILSVMLTVFEIIQPFVLFIILAVCALSVAMLKMKEG